MKTPFIQRAGDESGITGIEYGMIAALIVIGIISVVRTIGTTLRPISSGLSPLVSLVNGTGPASA
jgi:Flp pilus assembly pilin Flp